MPSVQPCPTQPAAAAPGAVVDAAVLGKALACGGAFVAAGAVVAWATGLVPGGALDHVALGATAALVACAGAVWLHGRFLDPRASAPFARDGRLMAGRVQSLLAAAFGVKLAVLVLGVLALRQGGAKFAEVATFCVTFAAAALVCQLATAFWLSRAISRRSAEAPPSPPSP